MRKPCNGTDGDNGDCALGVCLRPRRFNGHTAVTWGTLYCVAAEFKLLGEVEACMDGHPLDIGHARQRCVLASLLVDVNKPVSVDQLIDRVWSAEPPHRARNALAGYLSRLRALLADASALQITRGPAGYTLTAEALSVDLHLFRHLAAEARSTADPREATGLFGRAL